MNRPWLLMATLKWVGLVETAASHRVAWPQSSPQELSSKCTSPCQERRPGDSLIGVPTSTGSSVQRRQVEGGDRPSLHHFAAVARRLWHGGAAFSSKVSGQVEPANPKRDPTR